MPGYMGVSATESRVRDEGAGETVRERTIRDDVRLLFLGLVYRDVP